MQGSKQGFACITSEQRTEPKEVGCAGFARYREIECRPIGRNKSGTAEVIAPLSLNVRDKGAFSFPLYPVAPFTHGIFRTVREAGPYNMNFLMED